MTSNEVLPPRTLVVTASAFRAIGLPLHLSPVIEAQQATAIEQPRQGMIGHGLSSFGGSCGRHEFQFKHARGLVA